jgi:dethiobiotin synthetase
MMNADGAVQTSSEEWIRSAYTGMHHDFTTICDNNFFDDKTNHPHHPQSHDQVFIPSLEITTGVEDQEEEGVILPTTTTTTNRHGGNRVGCFILCASWNGPIVKHEETILPMFTELLKLHQRQDTSYRTGIIQVDATEWGMDLCCGDNNVHNHNNNKKVNTTTDDPPGINNIDSKNNLEMVSEQNRMRKMKCIHRLLPCPPEKLPAILWIIRRSSMKEPNIRYLKGITADQILTFWRTGPQTSILDAVTVEINQSLRSFGLQGTDQNGKRSRSMDDNSITDNTTTSTVRSFRQPLRIFVGGDRMSVGKTSVCLGLLGNLIAMGYPPNRLGYIKPATQSESPQLVQQYCEMMGIPCVPVGPIVYYRGFTRAFLAGETETTDELLAKVEDAVDSLARDKDIVIVDGVGFPAVGSICGTDNASVALASSYPDTYSYGQMGRKALGVLLVGGPGVGSAVDAFNLNATYFQRVHVPVLGAVFNKLSLEGFYSLENCKKQISMYFAQNGQGSKPFGFIPVFPQMAGEASMEDVHDFIRIFGEHFNMDELLEAAYRVQQRRTDGVRDNDRILPLATTVEPPVKRRKVVVTNVKPIRTREEIEQLAISVGAAPSA